MGVLFKAKRLWTAASGASKYFWWIAKTNTLVLFITRLDHLNVTYFLLDQPKLCHVLQYNERTLRYFEYKQISRKNFNDKIKSMT